MNDFDKGETAKNVPRFLSIRQTAQMGILSEYNLRLMIKQGKIPHIMCGNKCMINYPLLLKQLDEESMRSLEKKGGQYKQ